MKNLLAKKEFIGWTAVDAGAGGLYGVTVLAPAASGGKPRVVKCSFVPGAGLDVESLNELSKKISMPGCPWVMSLARGTYNLLTIPEPAVQQDELEQSVRWSVGTMIDTPVDEGGIAFMKMPAVEVLPNRPPHMYVAFVKNEVITGCNAVFQQAGIDLRVIDVRETAQRNISVLTEKSKKGSALLMISKQGVQFTVTHNGMLYLDRFIEEFLFIDALHDADAKERAYERIVLQLQRSLDYIARTLPFIDIERIHVVSASAKLDHADFISQQLQMPVEILDLASIFDFSRTPDLLMEENQSLYFTALGAALRFSVSAQQINLQFRHEPAGLSAVRNELAVLGLLLVSLLCFWGVRQWEVASAREDEATSLQQLKEARVKLQEGMPQQKMDVEAEIAALLPRANAAKEVLNQTASLGSQQGYAQYFSLLAGIAEKDLWLTNVTIDKGGKSIRISGRALDKESVLRYAQRLNVLFAGYGVQFTALELSPESVGTQGGRGSPLTAVAFKLY